jgi:CheY-like chemotaxis protein
MLQVNVLDTGPGIQQSDQKRIFEDFYRGAGDERVAGLGLGLGVASRFTRLLGHSINCVSVLGRGSCFSIELPIAAAPASVAEPSILAGRSMSSLLQGVRVIYVDDDPVNVHAMCTLLESWGCVFCGAEGAQEALSKYQSKDSIPEILVTDFQLENDCDGITMAEQLYGFWQQSVPTCVVSGVQDVDLTAVVKTKGMEFLRKPIKPAKLRVLLEYMVKRKSVAAS